MTTDEQGSMTPNDKPKHTPGPWVVDGEDCQAVVLSPSGWVIAETEHVHVGDHTQWDENHLANMNLIAAAPDLLAACIALQSEASDRGCGLRIADDAIAKATGAHS